jgi:hypothetical protein
MTHDNQIPVFKQSRDPLFPEDHRDHAADSSVVWPDNQELEEQASWRYLTSGGQCHIYASGPWVLKIPRISPYSLLTKLIIPKAWQRKTQGPVAAYLLPEKATGPLTLCLESRGLTKSRKEKSGQFFHKKIAKAYLTQRIPRSQFLLQQFYRSRDWQCVELLRSQLAVLEALAGHGWYLVDFILANFAFHQGRLVITDTDLLVPGSTLWQPSLAVTSWSFRKFLTKDYRRLLLRKKERSKNPLAAAGITEFITEYTDRIAALPGKARQVKVLPHKG